MLRFLDKALQFCGEQQQERLQEKNKLSAQRRFNDPKIIAST